MRCVICRKKNAKACSRCKSIHYCSKECQVHDWPIHKVLCREMAELSARPSEEHVLGLYFPETEAKPQLIWIKVVFDDEELFDLFHPRGVEASIPQVDSYLGTNPSLRGLDDPEFTHQHGTFIFKDRAQFHVNPRNRASTSKRSIQFTGRSDMAGFAVPQSLLSVATDPIQQRWRGPLVFQAVDMEEGECGAFTDVTLADFRFVMDCAMWLPSGGLWPNGQPVDDSGDEDDSEETE